MPAYTNYLLTAQVRHTWNESPGQLSVTNRDTGGAQVTVTIEHASAGIEAVILQNKGDAVSQDLTGVRAVTIEATSYPAAIMFLMTTMPSLAIDAAPTVEGDPSNPLPVVVTDVIALSGRSHLGADTPFPGGAVIDPVPMTADYSSGGSIAPTLAANAWTVHKAGKYALTIAATFHVNVAPTHDGQNQVEVKVNGVNSAALSRAFVASGIPAADDTILYADVLNLAAGDVVSATAVVVRTAPDLASDTTLVASDETFMSLGYIGA